jgi:hypothetical protein
MRKIAVLLAAVLLSAAAAAPAQATFASDVKAQLKRHLKRVYAVSLPDVEVPSNQGPSAPWTTCASITIAAPLAGTVKVTASGWVEYPLGSDNNLVLSLSGPGGGGGQWYLNGTFTDSYTVEYVFRPTQGGTWTYSLKGQSMFGGAGHVRVVINSLTAEFMSNAISPEGPSQAPPAAE